MTQDVDRKTLMTPGGCFIVPFLIKEKKAWTSFDAGLEAPVKEEEKIGERVDWADGHRWHNCGLRRCSKAKIFKSLIFLPVFKRTWSWGWIAYLNEKHRRQRLMYVCDANLQEGPYSCADWFISDVKACRARSMRHPVGPWPGNEKKRLILQTSRCQWVC